MMAIMAKLAACMVTACMGLTAFLFVAGAESQRHTPEDDNG